MIHNFKVENFYSIREMQELDFTEPKKYDDSVAETTTGDFINTVNCLIGPNASGKTNILRALTFFIWFVEKSYYKIPIDDEIPFEKHALSKEKTTKFEIIFDNKKDLFKLELELNKNEVISEKLGIKVKRSFSKVYSITRKNNSLTIDPNTKKFLNSRDKEEIKLLKERKNCSFFSFLSGTGYLTKVGLKNIVSDMDSNVSFMGFQQIPFYIDCVKCSDLFEQSNDEQKKNVKNYITKFDLGITELSLYDAKVVKIIGSKEKSSKEQKILAFIHGNGENSFELPAFEESAGTIKALSLLCDFFETFPAGGLVIVDEIESSMHPAIVRKLVGLFGNKNINKNNAQLVFSTHQPLFLNDRLKRQIFLIEKENKVDTGIFRLDEVKPPVRNDENFFMKYLSGEYGAAPNIEVV